MADFLSVVRRARLRAFRPPWHIFGNGFGRAVARQQAGRIVFPAGRHLLLSINVQF